MASDGHDVTTGQLAESWLDLSDGVGWTNDFADVQAVHITEPSAIPATEDDELIVLVDHSGILTWGRNVILALRLDNFPLEGL